MTDSAPKLDRKARLQLPPVYACERDPAERLGDFDEITRLHIPKEAIAEAARCLQCPNAPCQTACPLHNDIPRALALLSAGQFIEAALVYRETNPFPEINGRVCPDYYCQDACTLNKLGKPIDTRHLEAFLADYVAHCEELPLPERAPLTGKRIAVVGAGPAGLTVAEWLTLRGHHVTVYEQNPAPGGLLVYGIPAFKLSPRRAQEKTGYLTSLDVEFICGVRIGQDVMLPHLLETYDAVFLGVGAQRNIRPELPGEALHGVIDAVEFLVRAGACGAHLPSAWAAPLDIGPRVHVLGAGGTAMDCLRTALRLPSVTEATCYYRRSEAEMPSPHEDFRHAQEEGAQFVWLASPRAFLGDTEGRLRAVRYQHMELGPPDDSGRRRPVPIPDQEITVEADTVVLALGYGPDPTMQTGLPELQVDRRQRILVDTRATGRTSVPGLFAAGDVVRGADMIAPAVADALGVAQTIAAYLTAPEAPWPTPQT